MSPLFNCPENDKKEPVKVEPVKFEKVNVEQVKVEPVKVEEVKAEPVKVESVKVDEMKKEIEKLQKQKKDLLIFIFGDNQLPLIEVLFKRFEDLNIEEMVAEVQKDNAIIDNQNLL